jgi:alpha-N-acetylglucosamine transferase
MQLLLSVPSQLACYVYHQFSNHPFLRMTLPYNGVQTHDADQQMRNSGGSKKVINLADVHKT